MPKSATFPTPVGESDGSTKAGHASIPTYLSSVKKKRALREQSCVAAVAILPARAQRECETLESSVDASPSLPRVRVGEIQKQDRLHPLADSARLCPRVLALYEHSTARTEPRQQRQQQSHLHRGERSQDAKAAAAAPCLALPVCTGGQDRDWRCVDSEFLISSRQRQVSRRRPTNQ